MNEKITLQIDTAGELRAFAKDINSGRYHGQPDLTVKLTADIDLGGVVGTAEDAKITVTSLTVPSRSWAAQAPTSMRAASWATSGAASPYRTASTVALWMPMTMTMTLHF